MGGYNHRIDCMCGWCYKESYSTPVVRSTPNEYTVHHASFERTSSLSTCKHCDTPIHFVHHNSGIVCFEELGYPWIKHDCLGLYNGRPEKSVCSGSIPSVPKHIHTVPENIWRLGICRHIEFKGHGKMTMRIDMINSNESFTRTYTYTIANQTALDWYLGKLVFLDKNNVVTMAKNEWLSM